LDGARRRVAISELDAGRQADSLSHRRERKAAIGVPHGMAEPGDIAQHMIMPLAELFGDGAESRSAQIWTDPQRPSLSGNSTVDDLLPGGGGNSTAHRRPGQHHVVIPAPTPGTD
jgi:hypothetical protein